MKSEASSGGSRAHPDWFDVTRARVEQCIVHQEGETPEVFLNVADAATPLDRRASSVKWQPRGILDATEEGVAMIVGQRGAARPVGWLSGGKDVTTACRMQCRGSMIVTKRRHYGAV